MVVDVESGHYYISVAGEFLFIYNLGSSHVRVLFLDAVAQGTLNIA